MAVKSLNRMNVFINKNFIIRVENTKSNTKNVKLTSANKLSDYLEDEELKLKLFEKAKASTKQEVSVKLRRGLKITFRSK